MKRFFLMVVGITLSGIAAVANAAFAPYSADLVTVTGGRQSTTKVYVADSRLRTEVTTNSMQIVTITRLDEKVVYVLLPLQKVFVEKPLREEDGLLAYISNQNAQRELVGTETLKGQSCDKYKMTVRDQVFYVWINKSSHTPMLMFSADKKTRTEWNNVQVGPQPLDLFKPPGDFQKFVTPPVVIEE